MSGNGALDFTFSMVRFASDTTPRDYSFRQLMAQIREGAWSQPVAQVRASYQEALARAQSAGLTGKEAIEKAKDAAKPLKLQLPAALVSGCFIERNDKGLKQRTPAICCDLDELANPEGLRDLIIIDAHVLAAFISPTGTGLKVVFKIDPAKSHAECYRAAEHYVREHFGQEIDTSCRNLSRLCFVSHDPDLFAADDAIPLPDAPPLAEIPDPPQHHLHARTDFPVGFISPGDDFDLRGDWKTVLIAHGWTRLGDHYWIRPGKTNGISASWDTLPDHPNRFYVFSNNAPGFAVGPLYKPWHIFAILETHGDFLLAAEKLYDLGYGTRHKPKPESIVQQRIDDDNEAIELASLKESAGNGMATQEEIDASLAAATIARNKRLLANAAISPQQPTDSAGNPPPEATSSIRPYTLWKPSQFLAHVIDPNACILGPGYIELGQWTSFIGIGGLGKTRLSLHLAICQILLRPWCDLPTKGERLKWVILSTENGIRRWKGDLERMLANFTPEERALIDEHLLILAMTPDEDGDMNLANPATVARIQATLILASPGVIIFDPFADMVDGDENKSVDLLKTIATLRRITRVAAPKAASFIIHHARTGSANVAQAGDNFNAGNFGRGSKALFSHVRCEIQLAPADRDNPDRLVLSCGKANDCIKFTTRCIVFDPATFTYSIDPSFDVDAWRDDVAGKRKQSMISIADLVKIVHEKCPLQGDEVERKDIYAEFAGSGVPERTLQRYLKDAIDAGYLRPGKKKWGVRMGAKPLPK